LVQRSIGAITGEIMVAEDSAIAVPAANPAGLGLVAFGLTTVLLRLVNAGVLPPGGEGVVIPLALAFGGLMQIFAGAFEFKLGNTFGMTAFLSYGAFWWWFAFLLLFAHNHWIDISAAGPTVGVALLLWGVLTLYLWVSTFRLPRILFLIFLTLWVTFALLGFGAITANAQLTHLGGWLGIVCGSLAMYGSFGIVTNATFGRAVVPLGVR
jgi:hypothetical protein